MSRTPTGRLHALGGRHVGRLLFGAGAGAAALLLLSAFDPEPADAVEPCPNGVPAGKVEYQGTLTEALPPAVVRALKESGVEKRPIRPAVSPAGELESPVSSVSWMGRKTTVRLNGGLRLQRDDRSISLTRLRVVLNPDTPRFISGRVGNRVLRLFTLNRTKARKQKGRISEIELTGGVARLTGQAARMIGSRLGITSLRKGMVWSRPDLFVRGAGGGDLIGSLPPEAPPTEEPQGSFPVESGTIEWRIRESFVNYLSGGGFVKAVAPASAGPPESFEGGPDLVYSFSIPFASGWVEDAAAASPAYVSGSGGVWFRLCRNTINFTLTSPEILLDGDSSHLIVRAEGTDGTPYDGRRVLVLRLFPSRAAKLETSGRTTVLEDIPAYVAEGATGVFLSYPAFPGSVDDPAARFSRFGSMSITYTREETR